MAAWSGKSFVEESVLKCVQTFIGKIYCDSDDDCDGSGLYDDVNDGDDNGYGESDNEIDGGSAGLDNIKNIEHGAAGGYYCEGENNVVVRMIMVLIVMVLTVMLPVMVMKV